MNVSSLNTEGFSIRSQYFSNSPPIFDETELFTEARVLLSESFQKRLTVPRQNGFELWDFFFWTDMAATVCSYIKGRKHRISRVYGYDGFLNGEQLFINGSLKEGPKENFI
jgi:hypothetical protein